MTNLCVAIFVRDPAQAKRDIATATEAGADLLELRLDHYTEAAYTLVDHAPLPIIVTCRPSWEGGHSVLPDTERVDELARLSHLSAYTDVELETLRRTGTAPDEFGSSLIVSSHHFQGRPGRLYNILSELVASPADIVKIVWTARTIRDNLEALEILRNRSKPTIALCMGEAGLISRVLAKKFGGFLTFVSLDEESGTAPGQISIAQMKNLYRWDRIGPKTKVYGVVAHPVAHSMSPAVHNAAFDAIGYDGVYLPMLVEPGYESFKAFMESFLHFDGLDLAGLSVTIPHKENALRYLQSIGAEVEELAQRIGAVNTILIERDDGGKPVLRGRNTDYSAILDTITSALKIEREDLANYRVAVIGAGGTGRTAVAALASCGATVVVYNRTRARADELASQFDGQIGKVVSARMEKLCDSCCQIFINATSVGMHPKVDESPFGDRLPGFEPGTLVFDTVYNPLRTKLLEQAESAGAKTVGGVEMFVRQAAAQFEAWTGSTAPQNLMRSVIESRLKEKKN